MTNLAPNAPSFPSFPPFLKTLLTLMGMGVLGFPLAIAGWLTFQRPPQTNLEQTLFKGIHYQRQFRSQPRPVMLHIVTVDLTAPGLKVIVTPGTPSAEPKQKIRARTTSEFLTEFKLQLAVNASFFHHFEENTPWSYYPYRGDWVGTLGHTISNGVAYSAPLPEWPVFCIVANQRARIFAANQCPTGTLHGVAGNVILVAKGKPVIGSGASTDSDVAYSRVVVAVDKTGEKLWLIVVDDKQWRYSEGMLISEVTKVAIALGADSALNLDGGGSTTLVMGTSSGSKRLNSPAHTKIPMRERPVANHLGFYALPQ
jgi:hypothetical protein